MVDRRTIAYSDTNHISAIYSAQLAGAFRAAFRSAIDAGAGPSHMMQRHTAIADRMSQGAPLVAAAVGLSVLLGAAVARRATVQRVCRGRRGRHRASADGRAHGIEIRRDLGRSHGGRVSVPPLSRRASGRNLRSRVDTSHGRLARFGARSTRSGTGLAALLIAGAWFVLAMGARAALTGGFVRTELETWLDALLLPAILLMAARRAAAKASQLDMLLVALTLTGALLGVLGIAERVAGLNLVSRVGGVPITSPGVGLRVSGPYPTDDILAVTLLICFAGTLYLANRRRTQAQLAIALVAAPLELVGIYLTFFEGRLHRGACDHHRCFRDQAPPLTPGRSICSGSCAPSRSSAFGSVSGIPGSVNASTTPRMSADALRPIARATTSSGAIRSSVLA